MGIALRAALVVGLLVSLSGCLALQAHAPVSVPLATPEPPSRMVMPPASVPDPIVEGAPSPVVPQPPAPTPPNPGRATAPPPASASAPPAKPPAQTPPPTPPENPPILQTTDKTSDLEKKILVEIANANRDLDKVVRSTLPREAKDQYDWAKGFLRQALEAMASKNYNLAEQFSDKAARLASMLAKGPFTSPISS
jgi:hypothetical protein